ncbi:alpha/beta fold hydrolase [Bacillus horti]|uniref:Pimeloyl-ACP methyl ester carboxylesterase n=2 Tax=Caldalkalibacillus horti TaxID=77523 RepID=A0ABT9VZ45_9BACI|nr:alpha/beta hydrolase [Bacillus horti]MDQ0166273.1 pimeloyl-ACP methyl ester carboxylesterase [Bacillus horti]
MPTCQVNGVTLYYEVKGEGKPLVFTHGHSLYHKQWEPQVEYFSQFFKTIVWDARGHGHSTLPKGKVDPDDFSKDLVGLLDHLGIDSAILCGLSFGGHVSIQTAFKYPERVEGLILIGAPYTNRFNFYERFTTPISKFSLRLMSLKMVAKMTADMLSKINPDNHKLITDSFGLMTRDNFLRHWSGNLRMDSRGQLHKVKCPTLILYGDNDVMVGRQQQSLAEQIPNSTLKVISNAHHVTNLDNIHEVNEQMESFLKPFRE